MNILGKRTRNFGAASSSNSGSENFTLSFRILSRFRFFPFLFYCISLQKQKEAEEEYGRKLRELESELASSSELRQKLERKVRELLLLSVSFREGLLDI